MEDVGIIMVMAENEGGDDQKEMTVSGPKSPWKKPVVTDAPVMGAADSWPALGDVQQHRPKNADSSAKPPSSDPSLVQVISIFFFLYSIPLFSFFIYGV